MTGVQPNVQGLPSRHPRRRTLRRSSMPVAPGSTRGGLPSRSCPAPEARVEREVVRPPVEAKTRFLQCSSPPAVGLTANCYRQSRRIAVLAAEFER